MSVTQQELLAALAVTRDGDELVGEVRPGFDVFGIPHGGMLAGLVGNAALTISGEPDLFTVTIHYLRKAAVGPVRFETRRVGGSRRLATWSLTAIQEEQPVLTAIASVGDRSGIEGPSWTDRPAWSAPESAFGPAAGDPVMEAVFRTPAVAQRFEQRIVTDTAAFASGLRAGHSVLRSRIATDEPDQLTALVACDITPPAVWNVLGPNGWVPTVELTAHVRARPSPGPLHIEASTHQVAGGFLEEDALVHDSSGRLIVQSRQLALAPSRVPPLTRPSSGR